LGLGRKLYNKTGFGKTIGKALKNDINNALKASGRSLKQRAALLGHWKNLKNKFIGYQDMCIGAIPISAGYGMASHDEFQ
jgi:hypothetical protein